MGIHIDFIRMIDIMYKDATLKIRVNFHVGEAFHPRNGVTQGSPLSPIVYLLAIQSCISLLNISPEIQGISGNCPSLKAGAFADDLNLFLRNTDQLIPFRALLAIYENVSGAVNSWTKIFGLRVGKLRASDVLHTGWVEGRDINITNTLMKYLGMFLGAPEDVAKKRQENFTSV